MKKITFGMLIVNLIAFIFISIYPKMTLSSKAYDNITLRDPYFNIMTSNKSVYSMVKVLVEDKHNVEYIAKNKEEIEKFNFNEDVVNNISNMDFFIYTGKDYEPWAKQLIGDLKKDKVGIIDISRGSKSLTTEEGNENPYYLMDFDNYKIALFNIKNELQTYDPNNKDYYEDNYNENIKEYTAEYIDKEEVIKNKENMDIYYLDDSLEYFAKYINAKALKIDMETIDKLQKSNTEVKVVLYNDEKEIGKYKQILEINKVHLIKIDYYNENYDYLQLLEKAVNDVFNGLGLSLEEKNKF